MVHDIPEKPSPRCDHSTLRHRACRYGGTGLRQHRPGHYAWSSEKRSRAARCRSAGRDDGCCDADHAEQRHDPLFRRRRRSEEHTSELQSLMRISYAVFCLKKKTKNKPKIEQKRIVQDIKEEKRKEVNI